MSNVNNNQVDLETPAISALAAASKTPFMTAFKVTMGIGLARLALFVGGLTALATLVVLVSKLVK
jgi:hypothetical protein